MKRFVEGVDRGQAETIASLSHPNIVTIFSVEENEGIHFLTMERVAGKAVDALVLRAAVSSRTSRPRWNSGVDSCRRCGWSDRRAGDRLRDGGS